MNKLKIVIFSFLVAVIVIEYQISTLVMNANESDQFLYGSRLNLETNLLAEQIADVINLQDEIKGLFTDGGTFQDSFGQNESDMEIRSDSTPMDEVAYPVSNEPNRYQRRWADYSDETLDYQNEQIFQEQLKRFETSLTEMGRVELENRIQLKIEESSSGMIPGFESLGQRISKGSDLLTSDVDTLPPRRREIRERILKGMKDASLMEMHAEYTGLFDGGFPIY